MFGTRAQSLHNQILYSEEAFRTLKMARPFRYSRLAKSISRKLKMARNKTYRKHRSPDIGISRQCCVCSEARCMTSSGRLSRYCVTDHVPLELLSRFLNEKGLSHVDSHTIVNDFVTWLEAI